MNSSKRILVLSANPKDTVRERLDEEVREIEEGLRCSILQYFQIFKPCPV